MTLQELNQMSYDKIVFLWNEYCEEVSSFTDMLYTNDDEAFSTFGFTINGTLINNTNELYDWNDEYVTADVKGNPWSANDPKVIMDLSALLEWVNKGDNEKAFSQNNESDFLDMIEKKTKKASASPVPKTKVTKPVAPKKATGVPEDLSHLPEAVRNAILRSRALRGKDAQATSVVNPAQSNKKEIWKENLSQIFSPHCFSDDQWESLLNISEDEFTEFRDTIIGDFYSEVDRIFDSIRPEHFINIYGELSLLNPKDFKVVIEYLFHAHITKANDKNLFSENKMSDLKWMDALKLEVEDYETKWLFSQGIVDEFLFDILYPMDEPADADFTDAQEKLLDQVYKKRDDLRENDWFHGGSIRLFDFVLRGIKLNKDAILHSAHMINKNAVSS